MKKVPFGGATPDVVGHRSFFMERLGEYAALAFRDLLPLGARGGGRAVVNYPLVLALVESRNGSVVLFVAVEKGEMFDTCFLCAHDGEGTHRNLGSWDLDLGSEAFLERAITIARAYLKEEGRDAGDL